MMKKQIPGDEAMVQAIALLDGKHSGWTSHLVIDVLSTNPAVAHAVATRTEIKTVTEVGGIAEAFVVNTHRVKIEQYGRRCIIVLDMSAFPMLLSKIRTDDPNDETPGDTASTGDHVPKDPADTLEADLKNVWNTYSQAESIPMILVNSHAPFTGLKLISFAWVENVLAKK
jgi:hypothetical protein